MDPRKIWSVAVREFGSFFGSPIVYGFLTGYIFLLGYFNVGMIVRRQRAEFSLVLVLFVFLVLTPLLTMRLISNERATGTIEFIFTSPVRASEFVLGKYLAVLGVFGISLLFTLEFPAFLLVVGDPGVQILATQYLGLVLVGGAFLAVGLFCSCLTENQIVAAVATFSILLLLWVLSILKGMVPAHLNPAVEAFTVSSRIRNFQNGILRLNDLLFFGSLVVTFLYASVLYLNTRSWRQ